MHTKLEWQEADWWWHGDEGEGATGKTRESTKGHKEISEVILIVMVVSSVYTYVKPFQIAYFNMYN